ncbi:MAG: hypothetical protein L0H65_18745 [Pseudorhodobacter sp.]|nr:hypothetical protein [Pseudorhodobacter sp.]MDN5789049.1 hypothetical protein [Pseudorhodobacter sp.]
MTWVIDAVAIRDQTAPQSTDIQKRIPIRAVAREPCDIDRQDYPHFAEPNPTDKFLEPAAMRSGRAAQTKIGIDHVDIGFVPSKIIGALAKPVLQPQALLVAHDLMWCRLSL